jgi:hypothetical protein
MRACARVVSVPTAHGSSVGCEGLTIVVTTREPSLARGDALSFDLYVLSTEIATDDPDELFELLEDQASLDGELVPELQDVVDALKAEWPTLEQDPDNSPWSTDPLGQPECGGQVLALNIGWSYVEATVPGIRRICAERSLRIFDPQSGRIAVPDTGWSAGTVIGARPVKVRPDDVRRAVMAELRPRLEAHGFRKRAGWIFTIELDEEFLGWCGLNETWDGDRQQLSVLPFLCVRHQTVERTIAELAGRDFHPYYGVTIKTSFSELLSPRRFRDWKFDAGDDHAGAATDLAAKVGDFGLPWMREHATIEAVLEQIRQGNYGPFDDNEVLPVALAVAGRHAEALAEMDERVQRYDGESHLYAEELRAFAAAFRARFVGGH